MAKLTDLLVVSDVDGTLLKAGYGIPRENLDAIERFVKKGCRFTVCTGRSVATMRRYIDWLQPSVPAILNNGALIYDFAHDKVLYNETLPESIIDLIKEIISTFPDVGVEFHSTRAITVVRQNEQTQYHITRDKIPFELTDITKLNEKWNKVLLVGNSNRVQQLKSYVEKKQKNDRDWAEYGVTTSSNEFMEINRKGINKGTGLRKLAELLEVKIENTVAIGDYYNDLDMLEVARYTAAVADAPADIRSKVDITVSSCLQGGVGELLDSLESICNGFEQLRLEM